jgi:hypothetical protein
MGHGFTAPRIFNVGIRGRSGISSNLRGNFRCCLLDRRLDEPRSRCELREVEKNLFLSGVKPRFLGPPAHNLVDILTELSRLPSIRNMFRETGYEDVNFGELASDTIQRPAFVNRISFEIQRRHREVL